MTGPTKRRRQGEGSTYFRKSDQRWVGSFDVGHRDGKRVRKEVSARTHKEMLRKLQQAMEQHRKGLSLPNERTTIAQYLDWWATHVMPTSVKETTADGYRYVVSRYVVPNLGSVSLTQLAPLHVHRMQEALAAKGLSPRTIRQVRAILRKALTDAEQLELVVRNAAAKVKPIPIGSARVDDALTTAEARALLGAVEGDRLASLVTVGLAIGLRRGEILGLRWDDLDLDAGIVTINRSLTRRTGHGLVTVEPKTKSSRGTVPLPAICVRALRRRRLVQNEERLAAGPLWGEQGYVFTTPTGNPLDPRNFTRWYHEATTRAGLGPRRFHALRHSAATLMYEQCVPLEIISDTLRHAGLSITKDTYMSFRPTVQRQGADAMDRLLGGL